MKTFKWICNECAAPCRLEMVGCDRNPKNCPLGGLPKWQDNNKPDPSDQLDLQNLADKVENYTEGIDETIADIHVRLDEKASKAELVAVADDMKQFFEDTYGVKPTKPEERVEPDHALMQATLEREAVGTWKCRLCEALQCQFVTDSPELAVCPNTGARIYTWLKKQQVEPKEVK